MSPEPPLDATGIARRHFSTARKGFDPNEVRAYLHELAELVGRLQRGEAHERERADRAENRADLAEKHDQHRLVELLGEETARVLDAAREAGSDIRTKAEENAGRMVREAQTEARGIIDAANRDAAARRLQILAEADQLRHEAEAEVELRRAEGRDLIDVMRREAEAERDTMLADGERARSEAESTAEQIRAAAREQGRRLVGEAQAVRERMLGDLSRRRRTAREQLERLNAARERLLAAYEVVRRTVDEATAELTVALPEAKVASEVAMRRVSEEPEETVEVLEAELSVARMAGLVDDLAAAEVSDDELDEMLRELDEEHDDGHVTPAVLSGPALAGPAAMEPDEAAPGTSGPGDEAEIEPEPVGDAPAAERAPGMQVEVAGSVPGAGGVPGVERAAGALVEGAGGVSGVERAAGVQVEGAGGVSGVERAAGVQVEGAGGVPVSERAGAEPVAQGARGVPGAERAGSVPVGEGTVVASLAEPDTAPGQLDWPEPEPEPVGEPGEPLAGVAPEPAEGDGGEAESSVDELFARIRAGRPASRSAAAPEALAVTDGTTDEPRDEPRDETTDERGEEPADEPEVVEDPEVLVLRERDTTLAAVERELGRRLKRVLADEQNEVLDLLRRGKSVTFAEVVPAGDAHADRFAIAASPDLDAAAAHGAASVGADVSPSCDDLAGSLGRALVDPLRQRIARSFDDCDGDLEEVTERLRALYREWKGQHIGAAVRHYTAAAYAWGAYEGAPEGAKLRWLVDRTGEPCPDADDNALAGPVAKGTPFPTGDRCSPAHPGCRCLVVPADLVDQS
jgi:cell division septum initiation protein DivIVA